MLDFGISKLTTLDTTAAKLTETKALMGSPHYMSPEQLRTARNVDGRADTWSMGVVLYELLTGTMPFAGETIGAVFASILETAPRPIHELAPEVPRDVEDAVMRCLRRDPAERFERIGDLAIAIAPFGTARAHAAVERIAAMPGASPYAPPPPSSSPALPVAMAPPGVASTTALDVAARTLDAQTSEAPHPRPRRGALLAGAALLTVLVAGATFAVTSWRSARSPDSGHADDDRGSPAVAASLPPAVLATASAAVAPLTPIESVGTAPAESATTAPSVPSAAAAPAASSSGRPRSTLTPRTRPATRPTATASSTAPPPVDLDRRR